MKCLAFPVSNYDALADKRRNDGETDHRSQLLKLSGTDVLLTNTMKTVPGLVGFLKFFFFFPSAATFIQV